MRINTSGAINCYVSSVPLRRRVKPEGHGLFQRSKRPSRARPSRSIMVSTTMINIKANDICDIEAPGKHYSDCCSRCHLPKLTSECVDVWTMPDHDSRRADSGSVYTTYRMLDRVSHNARSEYCTFLTGFCPAVESRVRRAGASFEPQKLVEVLGSINRQPARHRQ